MQVSVSLSSILFAVAVVLSQCSPAPDDDTLLQQQVVAAIASASDLPQNTLTVAVQDSRVTISGTLNCEECGGMRTPGGVDTIQQSLGALIRAVPGVESVSFQLQEP